MDHAGGTAETLDSCVIGAVDAAGHELSARGHQTVSAELPGVGSIIAERYRLERLLGQGGMGAVFAGRHIVTGRRVALKVLRDDPVLHRVAALRMAREARAVGRIQHPNVVAVHDAGFAAGRPFIAMELLDGESLEQRIERSGPMSEREAISTLQQIACGVAAAHANGIIHRDLKPANILLCRTEAGAELVKVVDFGISKLQGDVEDDVLVTSDGAQLGTPVFMSPEQVRGDALDERTDVYALAVILYYTLSRRFPFHARTRGELFAKILTEPAEPLTGVSPALAAVVLRGLARDRAQRYASVAAFASALSRRPRSRARALTSRIVYLAAAVSGIALLAVPTRLMHAAQKELAPNTQTSASASVTVAASEVAVQPAAAEPVQPTASLASPTIPHTPAAPTQPAAPATKVRQKPRAPRPSLSPVEPAAPVARDEPAADQVKIMSW